MRTPQLQHRALWSAAIVIGLISSFGGRTLQGGEDERENPEGGKADKYLYIWAGDERRIHPDFLTVVNFNENSANYGRVLATVNAPTSGNEPHHCHLASSGDVILCGGLLSLLKDQDSIFYFDISKPNKPEFIKSTRAVESSITDDPYPLPNGGYLVTQMGAPPEGLRVGWRSSTPTCS